MARVDTGCPVLALLRFLAANLTLAMDLVSNDGE
jgi:hypothetical protein